MMNKYFFGWNRVTKAIVVYFFAATLSACQTPVQSVEAESVEVSAHTEVHGPVTLPSSDDNLERPLNQEEPIVAELVESKEFYPSDVGGKSSVSDLSQGDIFVFSPGDVIDMTVFGDEDLSDEYPVDGRGYITVPLAGDIKAAGKTVQDLQDEVRKRLGEGLIVNPKVSIEVAALRPFYIRGEVRNPGSYPVTPDLDVFKAIAIAGGLTPRAAENNYVLMRGTGADKVRMKAGEDTLVLPGDSLIVKQRFF